MAIKQQSKKEKDAKEKECCNKGNWSGRSQGADSGIYGLGFIGALFYYMPTATSFLTGVVCFLKALVWPAFLVYKLLVLLKA
jgi:hypothetical protein